MPENENDEVCISYISAAPAWQRCCLKGGVVHIKNAFAGVECIVRFTYNLLRPLCCCAAKPAYSQMPVFTGFVNMDTVLMRPRSSAG